MKFLAAYSNFTNTPKEAIFAWARPLRLQAPLRRADRKRGHQNSRRGRGSQGERGPGDPPNILPGLLFTPILFRRTTASIA